jgi:mono/diheme cytochrome c family protein
VYVTDAKASAESNRGAYLVEGVAHCSACHEARNSLGAVQAHDSPAGGLVLSWYAPALDSASEAGLHNWNEADIVSLLKSGRTSSSGGASHEASTMGPMAEVVFESLQHTAPDELHAMAVYLKSLPESRAPPATPSPGALSPAAVEWIDDGRKLYQEHCARCHGDNGEGHAAATLALAGNRAVTMRSTVNPIRVVLYGGYPPGTEANPRPYGMPPFSQALDDRQVAQVLSFIRKAWGNDASLVGSNEVASKRTGPLW